MAVLEGLEKEHNEVLERLGQLGLTVQLLEGQQIEHAKGLEDARKLSNFLEEKIIPHFTTEERIIFPKLQELTSIDKGLILSYLVEHKKILAEMGELRKIVSSQSGDFSIITGQIVKDLSDHARRENSELIPLVRRLITNEQAKELERLLGDAENIENRPSH